MFFFWLCDKIIPMPVKTDKRTANLFIAGGYCLVALIILVNYLGQTDSRERTRPTFVSSLISEPAEPAAAKGSDSLQRQLEEEKRINLEMRDVIRRLQYAVASQLASVTSRLEADEPEDLSIPTLRDDLIESAMSKQKNPFVPGKNPFAPFLEREVGNPVETNSDSQFSVLQCDPRLPFVFSGSNSHNGYYSNF